MCRTIVAACVLAAAACAGHQSIDLGDDVAPGDAPPPDGSRGDGASADPAVWRPRVIYLTFPDRFENGVPGNDGDGAADCLDPDSPTLFHGGDLAGVRSGLPYLTELGVGALWLTPLTRQVPRRNDACGYHGYWSDLTLPAEPIEQAMEPRLGTPAELDQLLDALDAADVRPILDVVVNHPGRNARIVAARPDWFHPADGCGELGPPEVYCPLSGLPDFALERAEVADYVTDATVAWLHRYRFAGVRMDTAKHVPLDYFARRWLPEARLALARPFVVGEVFADGAMAQFLPYLDAGFDSVFHFPLRRALVDAIARGGSLDAVAAVMGDTLGALGLPRALMMTTFLDNHDVVRFLSEAGDLPDVERVRRYRLALTALFTLPGIPQLYAGDELGMLGTYPDNRRDLPAWAFDAATRAGARAGYAGDPAETFELTRRLIALRRARPALFEGYYAETWRPNGGANVFGFYRAAGDDRVLVVMNGGGAAASVTMRFAANPGITPEDRAAWPGGTVLRDVLGLGAPATLTVDGGGNLPLSLPGRTAAIYVADP